MPNDNVSPVIDAKCAAIPDAAPPSGGPMVSVVMLAYNHGPYIREAIECVLKQQTSYSFELIIGEDCSKDDTREIALEYQKANPGVVRVIASEKNVGVIENLRRCEQACNGKYVAHCEGDDYWHASDKLQRQVEFLETHQDYSMVHGNFRMCFVGSGKTVPRAIGLPDDLNDADAFNEILSGRRLVWTLTTCMRRSVVDAVLRDCPECYAPQFLMGDTQRFLEIAHRGKVKFMPEVLATRRVLLESATQSKNAGRVLKFAQSAKDVLDHYIQKYGCSPEAKKAAATRSAIHLLSCAFEAGDARTAKAALEEYHKIGAPVPLEGRLYNQGSQSYFMKNAVRPILFGVGLWRKGMRRLSRWRPA